MWCLCVTHLFDEVLGIDCQVRREAEFALQDLIDGLLPVLGCERRLETNNTKLLVSPR